MTGPLSGKPLVRQALSVCLLSVLLVSASAFPWPHHHKKVAPPKLGKIKTIVLIIMENRSFDHMFGFLKRLNPEINGLTGEEWNPKNVSDPTSEKVYVTDAAEFVDPDPGHSFQAIREQVFGGTEDWRFSQDPAPMNGFAQQAESMIPGFSHRVMSSFRPEVIPAYAALATEFAVFDKWHSGLPSSTQPNRLFVHSATSHGATSNALPRLLSGFPQKTIYDSVEENGLSFGIYYHDFPAALFMRSLREPRRARRFHKWAEFKKKAAAGDLENLVLLEPRYFDILGQPANDDHPSHDVAEGQKLIKEIYETLRKSPQWEEMLWLITYDEHGGFHDHVPTPVRNVPSPDGLVGPDPYYFEFDRLGVRVPTIAVSPWINKGTVVHEPKGAGRPTPDSEFEHSSVPATIKKILRLNSDFLTKRDAWAGTFEDILEVRDKPRTDCPDELPSPPWSLRHSPPNNEADLTEWQEEVVQAAAQLVGHYELEAGQMTEGLGLKMTVKEASDFVLEATDRFLAHSQEALESGADEYTPQVAPRITLPARLRWAQWNPIRAVARLGKFMLRGSSSPTEATSFEEHAEHADM